MSALFNENAFALDRPMYLAALAYYGLPLTYNRVFAPFGPADLRHSSVIGAARNNAPAWVQINEPREDLPLKKAENADIAFYRNLTLDFEYPKNPPIAHTIGIAFLQWLVDEGYAEEGTPLEDSGAGCHICLAVAEIEISDGIAFNLAVSHFVNRVFVPVFDEIAAKNGLSPMVMIEGEKRKTVKQIKLEAFDIGRVLALPGTWRPGGLKKEKGEAAYLSEGYLRRWLPPYVEGRYPERRESAQLRAALLTEYTKPKKETPAPVQTSAQNVDALEAGAWVERYANDHAQEDRSAWFHSVVCAAWKKYGDDPLILSLATTIDRATGGKYDSRADSMCRASLSKAHGLQRDPAPAQRAAAIEEAWDEENEDVIDETTGEVIGKKPSAKKKAAKESKGPSQATLMVRLSEDIKLFHTPEPVAYALVIDEKGTHTYAVRSKAFKLLLTHRYEESCGGGVPNASAVEDALRVIESRAIFRNDTEEVYLRVAEYEGTIYLDLGDDAGTAIEIDKKGWRVADALPIKFRRPRGMKPLPMPLRGGKLSDLRKYINVSREDWVMIAAWLVGAIKPNISYPVLGVHGEQGSAKSTSCEMIRSVLDPAKPLARRPAKDEQQLMIAANNNWLLTYDNLSSIPQWMSDSFCVISTGGGVANRELYENAEETILDVQRPILLNGIAELATRSDLLDRSILISLPRIHENERRNEEDVWAEFYKAHPYILGGLLDAVVTGLRRKDSIKLERRPRMADFATWAVACEPALDAMPDQSFLETYFDLRDEGNALAIEASPLGNEFMRWFADIYEKDMTIKNAGYKGSATELLETLTRFVQLHVEATGQRFEAKKQGIPGNGRALSNDLKRLAPNLRQLGIDISFGIEGWGNNKKRFVQVKKIAPSDQNGTQNGTQELQTERKNGETERKIADVAIPDDDDF